MTGFVNVDRGRLVEGSGNPLSWQGIGLGNWLLPEGYMWLLWGGPQSARAIEAMIASLVGPHRATEFWRGFRDVFVAETDIAAIAAAGFDHVRLPINSRVLIDDHGTAVESGWALVDRLIDWCRRYGLWVVLDLHGAPGGQTGTEIDDSPNGRPELFTERRYRDLTVRLWTMIAERYADEPVIAGYDLLNEPLPDEYQHRFADDLVALYRDLTAAIRTVDRNHVIIYEGSHWATNVDRFTEVWDANSMIAFHKYWSPPDRPSIARFLAVRERLRLPLYLGESGENTLDWLQTTFQLAADHDIGWNFWPWKKLDTETSPCSVVPPDGWAAITGWAAGRAEQPPPDEAWATLTDLLDRLRYERCDHRTEVINAVLRRVPLRLPATGFSFRDGSGIASPVPLPSFRSDEAITVRGEPDFSYRRGTAAPALVVVLDTGDWVEYEVNLAEPARIAVTVEFAGDGRPELTLDGGPLEPAGARWRTPEPAAAGRHRLRLTAGRDATTLTSLAVTVDPRPD